MTDNLLVWTGTGSRDDAVGLLWAAVRRELATSGQAVGPVVSVYWYRDEVGEAEEWASLLVTSTDRYAALRELLIEKHPREDPEIAAVAISMMLHEITSSRRHGFMRSTGRPCTRSAG